MNSRSLSLPSQQGRRALITGTAGLGLQTSLQLARLGAEIVLAGRGEASGKAAASHIRAQIPGAKVHFKLLDLASLASISRLSELLQTEGTPIDMMICNAGVMSPPRRRTTSDGFELQFGVNYLGHFALVGQVLPLLRRSSSARVVSVTSLAQNYAKIDFDDLQSERRYVPGKAYCVSKFAQAAFAQELQRRSVEGGWNIASLAAHPGMARTNLFQSDHAKSGALKKAGPWILGHLLGQSAAAGAVPSVYAAASRDAAGGQLYGPTGFLQMKGPPGPGEFAPASSDPELATRLWALSEALTGIQFPRPAPVS